MTNRLLVVDDHEMVRRGLKAMLFEQFPDGPNSTAAIANLRRALEQHPESLQHVEIIDVLIDPERALHDGILVTPMLVKSAPAPGRRILGTLHDIAALLSALGLEAPDE